MRFSVEGIAAYRVWQFNDSSGQRFPAHGDFCRRVNSGHILPSGRRTYAAERLSYYFYQLCPRGRA